MRPTSACNLRCDFCFGPRRELPSLPLARAIKIVDFLAEQGAEAIVLSGGEPLLYRALPELCHHIRSQGLRLVLSTNGTLLKRRGASILPHVGWVGLPIDGGRRSVNERMRVWGQDHLESAVDALAYLRHRWPRIGVKLGTVVTKVNAASIEEIPHRIRDEYRPDIWKLYQFSKTSYGADNADAFDLSDEAFEAVVKRVEAVAADWGVELVVYRNRTRDGAYVFVNSNGDLSVVAEGDERVVANVQDGLPEAFRQARRFVDSKANRQNERATYPTSGITLPSRGLQSRRIRADKAEAFGVSHVSV